MRSISKKYFCHFLFLFISLIGFIDANDESTQYYKYQITHPHALRQLVEINDNRILLSDGSLWFPRANSVDLLKNSWRANDAILVMNDPLHESNLFRYYLYNDRTGDFIHVQGTKRMKTTLVLQNIDPKNHELVMDDGSRWKNAYSKEQSHEKIGNKYFVATNPEPDNGLGIHTLNNLYGNGYFFSECLSNNIGKSELPKLGNQHINELTIVKKYVDFEIGQEGNVKDRQTILILSDGSQWRASKESMFLNKWSSLPWNEGDKVVVNYSPFVWGDFHIRNIDQKNHLYVSFEGSLNTEGNVTVHSKDMNQLSLVLNNGVQLNLAPFSQKDLEGIIQDDVIIIANNEQGNSLNLLKETRKNVIIHVRTKKILWGSSK